MPQDLNTIVQCFQIEGLLKKVVALDQGFINDTYFVNMEGEDEPSYILQRKNQYVFKNVPAMMQNIYNVCTHLKNIIAEKGGDPSRETLDITPTLTGDLYFRDDEGEYWAMCLYIKESFNYQEVDNPQLAYSGGKAIGMFQTMLADFQKPLTDILPGFHNIRFRFEQWEDAVSENIAGRIANLKNEIDWIESRKDEMMHFYSLIERGQIPLRVAHNDTKISNILFDKNGDVLCLIDLDTVMKSSVLNDFGDAVRTYTNTGSEDEIDLKKVGIDLRLFESFAKGYLEQASSFLTTTEIEHLAFSAKYITFEQVMRFLMDYINGDKYYKIKSPDHNLQRTHAQFKLLQSMEENFDKMNSIIKTALESGEI
jgi:Ser/Thr protein kinase RdoA (MazF antagonist)